MKFMKLGSRPDTFYTADTTRSVASEVSTDLIIQVQATRFSLHKFPLLSKCSLLQKLCSEIPENTSSRQILQLPDFPGGPDSFELCSKFCYGITITLSAFNLVSVRCASEYLQMTEDVERGNLAQKLEAFFASCILNGWRDTLVLLQTTRVLPSWSEDLNITARCVDSIASKIISNPSKISYSRSVPTTTNSNKAWWGDDLTELGIDLYYRSMTAVGSKLPPIIIGDALRAYVSRWLAADDTTKTATVGERVALLETVISLLPLEKSAVPCSFLIKLLKAATVLSVSHSSRMELARIVGMQLEEATVSDLLVPRLGGAEHDVDIVRAMVDQFMSPMMRGNAGDHSIKRRSRSADGFLDLEMDDDGMRRVGKLVDGYLQVIAEDEDLGVSEFVGIAEGIPGIARVEHDHLYMAIDTYLKTHPELNKSERTRVCLILDSNKLSLEASMHAAQNERLPLRVVVKVLFSEHARPPMDGAQVTELPSNTKAARLGTNKGSAKSTTTSSNTDTATMPSDDQWSSVNSGSKSSLKSNLSTLRMRLAEDGDDDDDLYDYFPNGFGKSSKIMSSLCVIPPTPRKIFSKLWSISRSASEKK